MQSESMLTKLVKWVVVIALVYVGYTMFFAGSGEKIDLANYVDATADGLAVSLGVELPDNPDMVSKIHQYSDSKITVRGNGHVGVVYFDGKQTGLFCDTRSYSFFNAKLGEHMTSVEDNMTYDYDNVFYIIDEYGGMSTTYFYYNKSNNDCFAVIYTKQDKVAAMTYFNDYRKISERLSGTFY